ncbi:MAG: UDP-N-acetylglucosamine 2-epimerase (hydrolyzing) [Pontiellaceae bacterium]|nr:UDP-N-acetylglucosamine 2-epimerase (hydrolyzing) [Pontiellaceae bacterium]
MKKILFITGTRADFGKLKPLICAADDCPDFDVTVFATGMHLHHKYGLTVTEIEKSGIEKIFRYYNFTTESTMELTLAKTIEGISSYIREEPPDLIVLHGDRVEALAGAISGALNNILVAHIEGGEVSGTIDEFLRHSTSKMSHIHLVANDSAKRRLVQMGEFPETVFVIGSPDIDIMLSDNLPELSFVKERYEIEFDKYSILMFHPVTTEVEDIEAQVESLVDAVFESNRNYVVISPNNDVGSSLILAGYKRFENNPRFRMFPSIRFENFLVLLKNCDFIVGNSSAGIREAPYYNVPAINIGTRQSGRSMRADIIHCGYQKADILGAIAQVETYEPLQHDDHFGAGNSSGQFMELLQNPAFWGISKQKCFNDMQVSS